MSFWSILLTGIGLAMDAFAVSLTSGMCAKELRWYQAMRIALCFGIFQALMPIIGYFAAILFSTKIASVSHWIAFALLVFIGGKMLWEAIRSRNEEESGRDVTMPLRTLLVLAIATSIDALAVGVSFALLEVNIWIAAAIIGATTLVLCFPAVYIGKKFGALLGKKAEMLGGVILIAIGVKILIEGLL